MFEHRRKVEWNDVDAAGLVFFPTFLVYCHDAIDAMFGSLPGGYAELTMKRHIGVPTVHVEADYRAPLRYGDHAIVRIQVRRIGRTSVTFLHQLRKVENNVICAEISHIVAVTDLIEMCAIEIPLDVRAVLEAHLLDA